MKELFFKKLEQTPDKPSSEAVAQDIGEQCRKIGFDWESVCEVVADFKSEVQEFAYEFENDSPQQQQNMIEELGDVLFSLVNLARHLNIDAEAALDKTNKKFRKRFGYVEQRCYEENIDLEKASLAQMDLFWNEIRHKDKSEN